MKYLAIAKITKPSDVMVEISKRGGRPHPGAILCHCPELGFEGENYLYCRYGLGVPFVHIKAGDKLWIEPTINDNERWIFVGFADYSQSGIYLAKGKSSEPTEPMVLGAILNSFLQSVINSIVNATQIGWMGTTPVTLDPGLKTELENLKTIYLTTESTNILSKLGFIDKNN